MMVTLPSNQISHGCSQRRGRSRQVREARLRTQELARQEALDRLVSLLEADIERNPPRTGRNRADALSRLARLRSAHATYVLANMNDMERVGPGAWVRRRHLVRPE